MRCDFFQRFKYARQPARHSETGARDSGSLGRFLPCAQLAAAIGTRHRSRRAAEKSAEITSAAGGLGYATAADDILVSRNEIAINPVGKARVPNAWSQAVPGARSWCADHRV